MNTIMDEYEGLTQKILLRLPIKAFPTKELIATLQHKNPNLTLRSDFLIKDVMNTGDVTGILCVIDCKDIDQGVFAGALTHVTISPSEPLRKEIEEYQDRRARRLGAQYKQRKH